MAKKINFKTLSERAVQAAGLAGGVAASRVVNKAATAGIKKFAPTVSDKTASIISAGTTIVVGAFLPAVMGGGKKKSSTIDNIANGLMAGGATALGGAFGIPGLSGIEDNLSGAYDAMSYAAQHDLAYGNPGNVSGQD